MPLYEYECSNGHTSEAVRAIRDRANMICPTCGLVPHLRISLSSSRPAIPWSVLDGRGRVMAHHPRGGETEPPRPPDGNLVEV